MENLAGFSPLCSGGAEGEVNPATSGAQNAGEPSAHEGGQKGGPGGRSPHGGGLGGVPPQIQKRGRVAHLSNPTTSGTQNAGKPSAYEGGENKKYTRLWALFAAFSPLCF